MMTAAANTPWIDRLGTKFSDDRSFWRVAAVALGLIAFAKGIRIPNLWSGTQAMINYDHGIVKRGLFGATFGHWFHLERYVHFTVVSALLLAFLTALIGWLTVSSGVFDKVGFGIPVAVFTSSYAVTYFASLIGYLDIPLAILAVGTLLIRKSTVRFVCAIPVCLAALMIHELFLFVFLPVIVFSFVLDGLRMTETRARTTTWVMAAVLVCLSGAVTVRLAQEKLITPAQAQALYAEDAARADFAVKPDFYSLLTRSSKDNLRVMKIVYSNPSWDFYFAIGVVRILPVVILLLIPIVRMARMYPEGDVALAAALIAALSPLFMHVLGWDNTRWNTLVGVETFLVLLVLARSLPVPSITLSPAYRNAAILVIAISMATGGGLLDDQEIKTFPFASPLREMLDMMRHGRWSPPLPDPHPIDPTLTH